MLSQPLLIVWGTPAVPGGRWHLALVNLKLDQRIGKDKTTTPTPIELSERGNHVLHVSLRGFLLWSLGLAIAGYLLGVVVIHQRLESRYPKIELSYLDVALPTRWPDLNRKRGKALITQGRELIANKKGPQGFSLLRQGLARTPEDFSARLDVARIYTGIRIQPQAIKLLREGLVHGYPGRAYLELLFGLLAMSDQPEVGLETVKLALNRFEALPAAERTVEEKRFLDISLVTASIDAGRLEDAMQIAETRFTADDAFRLRLLTETLIKTKRPTEATTLATHWATVLPSDPLAWRTLAIAERESNDFAGMEAALDQLDRLESAHPDYLLFRISQYHKTRREQLAKITLDRLILRHGASEEFYAAASDAFHEIGYDEGLDRLEREILERGLSLHPVLWARLKLSTERKQWPELARLIERLKTSPGPRLKTDELVYLDTMDNLTRACLEGGSGTQRSLIEIVGDHPGALVLYQTLISALLEAGRTQTARQILVLAEGPFADARTLRDLRSRIDAALAATATATPALISAAANMPTWLEFKARFDSRVNSAPNEALTMFSEIRRSQPDWLEEHRTELEALELPLRARGNDPLLLQLIVRAELARDKLAPGTLLHLAREIYPSFPANARLILKETLRLYPENEEALALQRLYNPAPATSPSSVLP
jgi:hypothetical protein